MRDLFALAGTANIIAGLFLSDLMPTETAAKVFSVAWMLISLVATMVGFYFYLRRVRR